MVSDTLARLSTPGVSIWLDDWRVSIGVDPRLAHDTARTVAEARALWWLVDQPNLFVEIPAVKQGLGAIGGSLAEGPVTLLFSLDRYDAVAEAFLTGMERAQDAGRGLSRIACVASFFVSRVDTEIDRRLDRLGGFRAAALHGCAAIANACIAYERYERVLATERWKRLDRAGARPQRLLWASTGVKHPAYDATRYVVDLVAPGVVSTTPEATLNAAAEHRAVPVGSIRDIYGGARKGWRNSPPSVSITPTSCRCWRTRAWRSPTPAGMSWSRNSRSARTNPTAASPTAETAAGRRCDGSIHVRDRRGESGRSQGR